MVLNGKEVLIQFGAEDNIWHGIKLKFTRNSTTKVQGLPVRSRRCQNKFNNDIKEAPSVYSFKSRLRQLGYENL